MTGFEKLTRLVSTPSHDALASNYKRRINADTTSCNRHRSCWTGVVIGYFSAHGNVSAASDGLAA